ncbi:MAG: deoxyribonuclease IV [Candidatus Omnitrophica bacterium]|nr:deoxyribonuclease IV [Candidatus Omnitrophota bacterium]
MSIAGRLTRAVEMGLNVGCDTIQLFTKSNHQLYAPPIATAQAAEFRRAAADSGITPCFAHSAYLINLGSPDPGTAKRSEQALRIELERAESLGLAFLVLHPGARKESGEEECLQRIAAAAGRALNATAGAKVQLLYETAAGQGSCVGHRFEQLATLLQLTAPAERVGICFDTCHVFAAGYDLSTEAGYRQVMAEFSRIVGFNRLRAIHLNDSKKPLGSRVDRHEHIGQGAIGLTAFRGLMNDARLRSIPMVLETPKDDDCAEDITNLATLRGLLAAV